MASRNLPSSTEHKAPSTALWQLQLGAAAICFLALILAVAVKGVSIHLFWLLITVSFIAGMRYPLAESLKSIRQHVLDIDFLMLLVAVGAWILGHPEEGAFLLVLFTGSRTMESLAEERTKSAIEALTEEFPETAWRIGDSGEEEIRVEQIQTGDRLTLRPGEYFPVDSKIIEGSTMVDLSAITGEEEPLVATVGTEVQSGGVNGLGLVTVEALRPAEESSYQKILRLIQEAPTRKSPAQILGERVGRYFTVAILVISIGAFFWWFAIAKLGIEAAAYRAMALLVAGSPCALVLSIPSGVLAGIAVGARRGILFHGGRGLLAAAKVKSIAFDKTGTLTTGSPSVASIDGDESLLPLAFQLASASTHPASRAVVEALSQNKINGNFAVERIHEEPGNGVFGTFNGAEYKLGRPPESMAVESSCVVLSRDGEPLVTFHLSETPRLHAACLAAWLRIRKFKLTLLSGDSPGAAHRLGQLVGITDARGGLRPGDKYRFIEEASANAPVMMVGDGVNDAPALARADVAVAMGMRGSAAALAQADIVLVNDRLMDLAHAIELSARARRIIRQNIIIAVGAATVLVAFALAGRLPLALGVFGHEGGTVLVVLNSLRLLADGWRHANWREELLALNPSPPRPSNR